MTTKQIAPSNLCQFPFADGRSCRLPKSPTHEYLCVFHADRERRLLDQQALDAGDISNLFGPTGELRTSTEINAYLTRIAKHAVAGRISPQILPSLVYAASLLLQTRRSVYNEVCSTGGVGAWIAELRRLYSLRGQPAPSSPRHTEQPWRCSVPARRTPGGTPISRLASLRAQNFDAKRITSVRAKIVFCMESHPMTAKHLTPNFSASDIAAQGETIYQAKYKAEFEKTLGDKYVAVNVRNEDVTVADTAEDAIHQALQKDPHGLFHLVRVGHPAAFDAGWYMSCAS